MLRLVERTEKVHLRRAICYAFLEAIGEGQQRKWQFSKEERESGEHLAPHALEMTRGGRGGLSQCPPPAAAGVRFRGVGGQSTLISATMWEIDGA